MPGAKLPAEGISQIEQGRHEASRGAPLLRQSAAEVISRAVTREFVDRHVWPAVEGKDGGGHTLVGVIFARQECRQRVGHRGGVELRQQCPVGRPVPRAHPAA